MHAFRGNRVTRRSRRTCKSSAPVTSPVRLDQGMTALHWFTLFLASLCWASALAAANVARAEPGLRANLPPPAPLHHPRLSDIAVILIALLGSTSCQFSRTMSPTWSREQCPAPAPVPPEQASLYAQQSEWLQEYRTIVDAHTPGVQSQPAFGGHLLTADSNRAEALLQADAMKWVELSLDRFQEMGMQGVTLNIGYPILMPWFPDSARYLGYYQEVAKAVRRRGMTLAVEQIVLYTGTQFTPFDFKLNDLTLEKYTADQAQMAQILIDNLAPDYLTMMHEPDTVAELTGLRSILTPAVATAYVNGVLAGLRRGATLVGAGSGSWSSPLFADSFSKNTSVDFIDIHIYWINRSSVVNSYEMAKLAKEHGKSVVITEAGLYKSIGEGLEGTPHVDGVAAVYRRDVFSFWEPLDMDFLDITGRFARSVDTRFISIYWTNMFFSYIDSTPQTATMSYEQLNRQLSGQQTAQAWLTGRFTCAGKFYRTVIAGAR